MAFGVDRPPTLEELVGELLLYYQGLSARVTDFRPGGVLRTLYEGVALQLETLTAAFFAAVQQQQEEAVYAAWGFPRAPAVPATGGLTVELQPGYGQPVRVPAGWQVRVPGSTQQVYTVLPDPVNGDWTVSPSAGALTVPIRCLTPGAVGNVPARAVTEPLQPLAGVARVYNAVALVTGRDAASDTERRQQFALYVQGLARATVAGLRYAALATRRTDPQGNLLEEVRKAAVVEGPAGPLTLLGGQPLQLALGQVALFVANGQGGQSTSQDLVQAVQRAVDGYVDASGKLVDGYRPAGVRVTVYPAVELGVNVSGTLTLAPGADPLATRAQAEYVLRDWLAAREIGEAVSPSQLVAALRRVEGVYDSQITTPAGTLSAGPHQLYVPGTIALTVGP